MAENTRSEEAMWQEHITVVKQRQKWKRMKKAELNRQSKENSSEEGDMSEGVKQNKNK